MIPAVPMTLLIAALLGAAGKADAAENPQGKGEGEAGKSEARKRPGRDPVVLRRHGDGKVSWGDDAEIRPDAAEMKAIYSQFRITEAKVSPETVRAGETVTFTWKISAENSEPLAVPPWVERDGRTHNCIGGIQKWTEKVTGSPGIPPYDREGTRAREGASYADGGGLLFVDLDRKNWAPPVELRDIVPGPGLRRKAKTLRYAHIQPGGTYTCAHTINTKGFPSGVYVETFYYYEVNGRIIDMRQLWFTVR